ncbi:MAG: PAS domain-containing sensor histidine kinase [Parvularculales bacterium]
MKTATKTSPQPVNSGLDDRISLLRVWVSERTLAYASVLIALLLGMLTFVLLSSETFLSKESELLVLLVGIDLVSIAILLVFVGRQLFRLISERRRRMAGYQLRWQLVTLFGLITVLPSLVLVVFTYFVLDVSLRGWFSDRISTAVEESVTVADAYLEEHVLSVRGQILAMANDINREASRLSGNSDQFDRFLTSQARLRNLSEAVVFDSTGRVLANSRFAYALTFSSLEEEFYERARAGDVAITRTDITNRIRAGVRLNQFVDAYLLVGRFIDPNVSGAVDRTRTAVSEYQSLDIRQLDLKVSFAILFGMVALLLLLSAVWLGLNFANAIVLPLISVIRAAEDVRQGDLSSRVVSGRKNDEVAQLGRSFNEMLDKINKNREELVQANRQLDNRREFTEAVLGGVSSGVIGIDENWVITLPNAAALDMLSVSKMNAIGSRLDELVPEFAPLLNDSSGRGRRMRERNIEIRRGDTTQTLLARITTETEARRIVGYVVTFENVSDLLDAQRKAAWADVARRIAHEIKNPLTPIQLAAERLGAKYMPSDAKNKKNFSTYIDTIIRQVDDIGRLVNEFSAFARMPDPVMGEHDLVAMAGGQVKLFEAAEKDVKFKLETGGNEKVIITCDDGMIRQVITNLIQNAIDAMREAKVKALKIMIRIKVDGDAIILDVIDNGPGLPDKAGVDLTTPYVTFRKKGTGLGLAIVKKITEDHHGRLTLGASNIRGYKGAMITLTLLPHGNPSS